MWHDLWAKNQKGLVFAVGMICFLTAGIVVAGLPSSAKNQVKVDAPRVVERGVAPVSDAGREAAEHGAAAPGTAAPAASTRQSEWVLYITGAVRRPGVYNLPVESRLFQLVEMAGGLSASADPAAVNLAAVLGDGFHVHVPEKGEEPPVRGGGVTSGVSGSPNNSSASSRLIDINRASADELTALRGVGPVLAGNIVDYRVKNGRFHSVEDLLNVSGIGHRRLEDLRDSVTVGP